MLGEAGRDSRSARGAKRKTDREHRTFRGGRRGRGSRGGRRGGRSVAEQPDRYSAAAVDGDETTDATAHGLQDLVLEARRKAAATTVWAAPETAGWEDAYAAAARGRASTGMHAPLAAAVAGLPLASRLLVDDIEEDDGSMGEDFATAVRLVGAADDNSREEEEELPLETPPEAAPELPPPAQVEALSASAEADAAAEEALDELLAM